MQRLPGIATKRLEDKDFADGRGVTVQTNGLIPGGRLVLGVEFELLLDAVNPGGGSAVMIGQVMHQLIATLDIGRRIHISGLGLKFMQWAMTGRSPELPPDAPATDAATFSRSIRWCLYYADMMSGNPLDGAVPSELFTDPIDVTFGSSANIFAATAPTLGNGKLRTSLIHCNAPGVSGRKVTVPPSVVIRSEGNFTSLTQVVERPGIYTHFLLFREANNDAGLWTDAQVSDMTSYVDGQPILDRMRASDAAQFFNDLMAVGTDYTVASQTVPQAGERLNNVPGAAAAAGQGIVTVDWLPIFVPMSGYKASNLVEAKKSVSYNLTGTAGASPWKHAYRLVEPRNDANVGLALGKMGVNTATATGVTHNGAVGAPSDARMAKYIPLQAKTPGTP